jgi:hypothetical protein
VPIGARSRRESFLRRCRVYARKQLYFERGILKLGPQYFGCPVDCSGPKADQRNGCPKCEYVIRRKRFEDEVLAEFRKGSPGPEMDSQWPINVIAYNVNTAAVAASLRRRGYHPSWTYTFCRIVDIYRAESNRMRAIDNYNLTHNTPTGPAGPTPPRGQRQRQRPSEDEDDEE